MEKNSSFSLLYSFAVYVQLWQHCLSRHQAFKNKNVLRQRNTLWGSFRQKPGGLLEWLCSSRAMPTCDDWCWQGKPIQTQRWMMGEQLNGSLRIHPQLHQSSSKRGRRAIQHICQDGGNLQAPESSLGEGNSFFREDVTVSGFPVPAPTPMHIGIPLSVLSAFIQTQKKEVWSEMLMGKWEIWVGEMRGQYNHISLSTWMKSSKLKRFFFKKK